MTAAQRGHPAAEVDWYDVLGLEFGFAAPSVAARRSFLRLYQEYELSARPASAPIFTLETRVANGSRVWQLSLEDRTLARAASLGKALDSAEREFCARVMAHSRDVVWIHGATVAGPHRAALLCGRSGAGKSTLALAMAARGFRVLGDDVAVLFPRTGELRAFPRCFHLDRRSRRLLRGLGLRTPGATPGFVTPADVGRHPGRAPDVRSIVLLDPRRNAEPPSLQPISQAETLGRMIEHAGSVSHPTTTLLGALGKLVGGTSCFKLARGRIGDVANLIAGLLEST